MGTLLHNDEGGGREQISTTTVVVPDKLTSSWTTQIAVTLRETLFSGTPDTTVGYVVPATNVQL